MSETREQWLDRAVEFLKPIVEKEEGVKVPDKIMVGVGFPKGGTARAIGQCFDPVCTADGTVHIFVSPVIEDVVQVLHVLLHEIIHATVGCECGHRGAFVKMVKAVGLVGRPTATYAEEGSELHAKLVGIADQLGKYPHVVLQPNTKTKRPAAGGWVKLTSPENEEYILRISPVALRDGGYPQDPWGNTMVEKTEE